MAETKPPRLWKVELLGLRGGLANRASLSPAFVVATDADSAYAQVKAWADAREYGFYPDRALKSVELVAELLRPDATPGPHSPLFIAP